MAALSLGNLKVDAEQARRTAAPILILLILAMMILPLPPLLLDLLFTFNIAFSLMVLLVGVYVTKPLDFASFPTILLLTTLMRLSLNVASTRVVLMDGHKGADAAGKVIESFAHFVIGGNFAVGLVVFVILTVINFVVITKGAGRIAEVGARFTLDAMPGKQMAIDADLNAGLIGEAEAKKRRAEVAQEAEFFGSMDGASKFVRGDAVAGILILVINMIGGLVIGLVQHGLSFAQATDAYVVLAIGDGLVAQIPAIVISTAAGLVVSRVGDGRDVGAQVSQQLFGSPSAIYLAAAVLALIGLIPGMPWAFLVFAGLMVALGRLIAKQKAAQQTKTEVEDKAAPAPAQNTEASWDDVTPVDTLGLEVGYRLIPMVDKGGDGDLLKRIKSLRKKFAQDLGFLPPPVHIRDNLELKPNAYRIQLKGVTIAEAEVIPGQFMAINPGGAQAELGGVPTTDPAFGLPAQWIDGNLRDMAQSTGYTVVDAGTVVATHLSQLLNLHSAELLGRAETQALLDHFSKAVPKVVEDLVPKLLPLGTVQRVLQNLLEESVHIRDLRTILETLAEHAGKTTDPTELTAVVRVALARAIAQTVAGPRGDLTVLVIEPDLERLLNQAAASAGAAAANDGLGLEPGLADALLRDIGSASDDQEAQGVAPVLLVPDRLRLPLARMLRRAVPRLRVMAHSEVPDTRTVRVAALVGGAASRRNH